MSEERKSDTPIHTYVGDGAFAYAHDTLIAPFLKRTMGDSANMKDFDWSAKNRVLTDGAIVKQSIEESKAAQAAAVKYPGATPDKDELPYLKQLTGADPKTALGRGNSPNAPLRGANGFDASIVRTPAKSAELIEPLKTQWTPDSKVEIDTLKEGGRAANQHVTLTDRTRDVEVVFVDQSGTEHVLESADGKSYHLEAGSPISFTHVDKNQAEKTIRASLDKALAQKADVMFSLKDTVLKSVDLPLKDLADEIYKKDYQAAFEANGQSYKGAIVDDGFAWLLSSASSLPKPQIMLSPDDLYGKQMAYVLEEVKKHGLHQDHTRHPVAIGRFSNGVGDEYGGMHFPGVNAELAALVEESGGTLLVRDRADKKEIYREEVAKGENMWLVSAQDVGAARTYARRMITLALDPNTKVSGKPLERLLFGFDKDSKFEGPFAAAIQEEIDAQKDALDARGIEARVVKPEIAAAESLANPSEKGTMLALNNLWGDIIADLYPMLANNRASYDSILLSDRGFVVETGSGGTAPDLLFGQKNKDGSLRRGGLVHTGKFNLNPIGILSGYAQAARYANQGAYADALEAAIDKTVRQGYLTEDLINSDGTPKLRPGLRDEQDPDNLTPPRGVDSRIFVPALEVNLLHALGKDTTEARKALAAVKDADSIPLTAEQAAGLAQYATRPGDMQFGKLKVEEVGVKKSQAK